MDCTAFFVTFTTVKQGSLKHCKIRKKKETRSFLIHLLYVVYSIFT
ncbi:hypothetical protein HMPREF0653_02403 [Prevotella disiens JCM 6334 = ATCC 29426]|uniref:Uncharacterized protein n=1 Tax=Prevotella disiens JCM 6334 = ATCC 29426 TaxID=1235811 RepID=A0ABN0NPF5_9BACT|nr:hypothetical protein HMPREF0653_02403 [Prevotella disiens JCM 6334 = ATCC 29426]